MSLPAAQLGLAVIVTGHNLGGEDVLLRFQHSKLGSTQELPVDSADVSAKELKVLLPQPGSGTSQTDWAPGVYTVTVVQKQSGTALIAPATCCPLPSPLSSGPSSLARPFPVTRRGPRRSQSPAASVYVRISRRFFCWRERDRGRIDGGNPDKVIFVVDNAPVVTNEPIRLRVDGIESMPFNRLDTPPPTRFEFDANQRVTIT